MVPIKIQCDDCGQKYAFDVEPVNGRMPSAIACPTCGADGTTAANESIARLLPPIAPGSPIRMISPANPGPIQTTPMAPMAPAASSVPLPPPPPIAPTRAAAPAPIAPQTEVQAQAASAPRIHVSSRPASSTTAPRVDPRLGLVDRNQAEHEARAKAMWGDSQDQVTGYLLLQGFSHEEAMEISTKLFKERTSAVRANGIRKFIIGFGMMWVPVIAFIIFRAVGFMPLKLMGAAVLVGVYGVYLEIMGLLMAIAPKSEKGDVADQ